MQIHSFSPHESGFKRTVKEYLRENFYGGILAGEFAWQEPGRRFLQQMPIPPVDRDKIAHGNAERLLGLTN